MNNNDLKILLDGCNILKNKHFYSEVFNELIKIKNNELLFNQLEKKEKEKIIRLLAQCKYQNKEIPSKNRFHDALALLNELDEKDCEVLCLKGAVYKRKYELKKKIEDLYKAITFYELASKDIENDKGYGAVNAIYLYFHLINIVEDELVRNIYKQKIITIRDRALKYLTSSIDLNNLDEDTRKWIFPTIAELFFSFNDEKNFIKAKYYLNYKIENFDDKILMDFEELKELNKDTKYAILKAKKIKRHIDRDKLITLEQLVTMYKLMNNNDLNENQVFFLVNLFENYLDIDNKEMILNIIQSKLFGKFGLALSGGGFRASLFHIGVFARLAELDILKHLEVISTVSGGSIVGMQYYIMLKKLLETKSNSEIKQNDYIDLVESLESIFLEASQKNIRMKAFKDFNPCIETITNRLGKLYQDEIYNKSYNWIGDEKETPINMKDLIIFPKTDNNSYENSFKPHFNNIEINHKVPILVINSTVLNNGHNWRFTASAMGESQYMYDTTIDKNIIYKYVTYDKFKDGFENISIADAIASSSCVPGLFDPLELRNIYSDNETIKLVDGGLYDNQGLASLIDEECNVIFCSDGSGQFIDKDNPSSCRIGISSRSRNTLMKRTRDLQYCFLNELYENKVIQGLCIVHLKQCFSSKDYEPNEKRENSDSYTDNEKIIYDKNNLSKEIQDKLSKIRTDLDAFNEIESYSLIYSGYTITSKWIKDIKKEQIIFDTFNENQYSNWKFLKIKNLLNLNNDIVLYKLDTSTKLFLKYFPIKYKIISVFLLIILIVSIYYIFSINILNMIGFTIVSLSILFILKKDYIVYKTIRIISKPFLWIIAKINLKYLNEKYLEDGKIK